MTNEAYCTKCGVQLKQTNMFSGETLIYMCPKCGKKKVLLNEGNDNMELLEG